MAAQNQGGQLVRNANHTQRWFLSGQQGQSPGQLEYANSYTSPGNGRNHNIENLNKKMITALTGACTPQEPGTKHWHLCTVLGGNRLSSERGKPTELPWENFENMETRPHPDPLNQNILGTAKACTFLRCPRRSR